MVIFAEFKNLKMRKIAFTSLALASSMVFAQENQSAKDSLVISNKKELDSLKL